MSDEAVTRQDIMDISEVYADLGGIAEICEALGVKPHRVKRWIERRDATACPSPIRSLGIGNIYSIRDWKGWFALWRITRGSETWVRKKTPSGSGDKP